MPATRDGVYVQGLTSMRRVLRESQHTLGPQLQSRLRATGEGIVAPAARRLAPRGERSALYRFAGQSLHESIRTSVTLRGASVYSTVDWGGVQNYGGRVGRNQATLLRRADVSRYMTRAVAETRPAATRHIEGTLDWLARELGS